MSSGQSIRAFIAVSIPCDPPLAQVLKDLGSLGKSVRPLSPDGLHCTLKFLGDVPTTITADLGQALQEAVGGVTAFPAELTGVGAFPHPQRPSVVWAGLAAPEMAALFEAVEAVAVRFGFAREQRPFQPHVTLARVRFRPPPQLAQLLERYADARWGQVSIEAVKLFQSTLGPNGSRYDVLATAPLRSASG